MLYQLSYGHHKKNPINTKVCAGCQWDRKILAGRTEKGKLVSSDLTFWGRGYICYIMKMYLFGFALSLILVASAGAEEGNRKFLEILRHHSFLKEDRSPFCEAAFEDFKMLHGKPVGSYFFHSLGDHQLFVSFVDSTGRYRIGSLPWDFESPLLSGCGRSWSSAIQEWVTWRDSIGEANLKALAAASGQRLLNPLNVGLADVSVAWTPAEWEAVKPLFCEGDAILDEFDSLPIRGKIIQPLEAEQILYEVLEVMPDLARAQLRGSQLVHGSSSASLLAFTDYGKQQGHLIPLGELEASGRIAYCGEIVFGRSGVNRNALSTVWVGQVQKSLIYAKAAPWSLESARGLLKELEVCLERSGRENSQSRNQREVTGLRIREWVHLSDFEKHLVSDSFPVLYGIRSARGPDHKDVGSDVSGEIALLHGAHAEEIRVVFVPRTRIPLVQGILKGFSWIGVEPLESFAER